MANLNFAWEFNKNGCNNLSLLSKVIHRNSILVNLTTTTFPNINLTKASKNLLVVSKVTKNWLQLFLFPSLYR